MAWTKMSLDGYRDMDQAIAGCVYWNSFYWHGKPVRVVLHAPAGDPLLLRRAFRPAVELSTTTRTCPASWISGGACCDPSGKTVCHGRIQAQSDTAF